MAGCVEVANPAGAAHNDGAFHLVYSVRTGSLGNRHRRSSQCRSNSGMFGFLAGLITERSLERVCRIAVQSVLGSEIVVLPTK